MAGSIGGVVRSSRGPEIRGSTRLRYAREGKELRREVMRWVNVGRGSGMRISVVRGFDLVIALC